MISVLQAQASIDERVAMLGTEDVPLGRTHERVLREPVASTEDLPPFDRSAMDGYAVRADDDAQELGVIGEIRAGEAIDLKLKPGQAVRIFTGARLPGSGLRVIMQEDVEARDGRIHVRQRSVSSHVRKRGEDARMGEVLLEPGLRLDATAVALLASLGKVSVAVSRQPRILHLTTGDEIVSPEQTPRAGQIRNSNASLVAALCREAGIEMVTHVHARDDLAALSEVLSETKAIGHDLVLISGGSGSGSYDFSGELFQQLGAAIHFRQINVRPGKPLIFGTSPAQIVFGLPGNALSHFVCFHLFVRRALDRLLGRQSLPRIQAVLAEDLSESSNPRETWWPARADLRKNQVRCRALPWKSSGDITRLPAANALIQVPASTSHLAAGTMVELLPTRDIFS